MFSLNFATMKAAVREMDPTFVGFGRGVLAAAPALLTLLFTRQPWPGRRHWGVLVVTSLTAVVGFSYFLAIALQGVAGNHAAMILGLMPIATAVFGSWRERERQSALFWIAAALGSVTVVAYAFLAQGHRVTWYDLALLGSVISAAVGYTEGARLSREIGSWQVICWSLVVALPFLAYPTWVAAGRHLPHASAAAWSGLIYAGFGSLFLGYIIWYRALRLGGIARVGQVQLLQPFMGLGFCALLLGERLTLPMAMCAGVVLLCVMATQWSRRGGPTRAAAPQAAISDVPDAPAPYSAPPRD